MFAGLRSTTRLVSIFSRSSAGTGSGLPIRGKRASNGGREVAKTEERSLTIGSFLGGVRNTSSKSGEIVNMNTAQTLSAVWRAVKVRAETIGSLSFDVYRESGGVREKSPNHPVARLLRNPHPLYNGQTLLETLQAWVTLTGNAFAVIQRNGAGQAIRLRHVRNNLVKIDYDENRQIVFYTVRSSQTGDSVVVDSEDMIHLRSLVWDVEDGWGKSPIQAHRDTIGLGIAGQGYMSGLMKNGAHLSGILTTDQPMSAEVAAANKASWQKTYGGIGRAGGTAVLQGGMTYKALSLSPADAKWLEMMEATTEDVSRIFGVPMHKLSALKRSTNNNIEHQGREFVTDTVRPDANRIEQEFQKLFSSRSNAYFRFNLDSLMRGDTDSRAKMYTVMLNTGTLNRDEVRRLEGFNPMPDGEGKVHLYPVNYAPMDQLGAANQGAINASGQQQDSDEEE